MKYQTMIVESSDHIATITLNRPDNMNALNYEMAAEILDAMSTLGRDLENRVIVLTGAGKAFCAGADLQKTFLKAAEAKGIPPQMRGWSEEVCSLFRRTVQPIIASVNGAAIGFGCAVCLTCDIRIAAESARFGMGFVRAGITPGDGATYYLPRLVGLGKACELTLTSRVIDAREAERIRLVDRVVADNDLQSATYQLARAIADSPPIAVRLAKQALHQSLEGSLSSQLRLETLGQEITFETDDHVEAVSSFLEKRKPVYKGK